MSTRIGSVSGGRLLGSLLAFALLMGGARSAGAQSATQLVTFRVVGINRGAVAAVAAALPDRTASTGLSRGSYSVATNEPLQKIVAGLDRDMPQGTALSVALTAPRGARSSGTTQLGAQSADVVTGLIAGAASDLPMVYSIDVHGSRSEEKMQARTVTYTIITGQ
ncbi:MAG: hypothetical protein JWN53_498 [Gemmatimonadetes bacterium]|nr:hypothetical protein [Gemmatimonadota bacterium]